MGPGPAAEDGTPASGLLTVLGLRADEATYVLADGTSRSARLSAGALLATPASVPDCRHVYAVCTPEARAATLPVLEEIAAERSMPVTAIEVSAAADAQANENFLESVCSTIGAAGIGRLAIDLTHGYRHQAVLAYVAALYLDSLEKIEVSAVFYGMPGGHLADLRPLIELPRWLHAVRSFTETGAPRRIAAEMRSGERVQTAHDIADDLDRISDCFLGGLPLELGAMAGRFLAERPRAMRKYLRNSRGLPMASDLVDRVVRHLEPMAVPSSPGDFPIKRDASLDETELRRQARMIDRLLVAGDHPPAVGLMREWLTSWTILSLGLEETWLERSTRRRADRSLHRLEQLADDEQLNETDHPTLDRVADFFKSIRRVRNGFAHHGMKRDDLGPKTAFSKELERVLTEWQDLVRSLPPLDLGAALVGRHTILVTAVGTRPGVLYSALTHAMAAARPAPVDVAYVVCSAETRSAIAPVVEETQFGGRVEPLVLDDPFGGLAEVEPMARRLESALLDAEQVLVNVTGGTTLMGIVTDRIARHAESRSGSVRRFALIDRRPSSEQERLPFTLGELAWLDSEEEVP